MVPVPEQPDRVDGARPVRALRRCRAAVRWSPDRTRGIIGIKLPLRSVEHVAFTDGACRDLTAPTEKTSDSGAADRECLLLRTGPRRAANSPDARSSQMQFVLRLYDPCSWFLCPSNVRASPAAPSVIRKRAVWCMRC